MIRILRTIAVLAVVLLIAVAGFMRVVPDDGAEWHADPATAERTGRPNDYLVAPAGTTAAEPDRAGRVHATEPRDLLFQLDAIARPAGAQVVAGSLDELWITYVQRSTLFGFPDYISVKAVPVDGGSALIIWSRARYGHSDWGVNKDRIERWLTQLNG